MYSLQKLRWKAFTNFHFQFHLSHTRNVTHRQLIGSGLVWHRARSSSLRQMFRRHRTTSSIFLRGIQRRSTARHSLGHLYAQVHKSQRDIQQSSGSTGGYSMLGNVESGQRGTAAVICQHQGNMLLLQGEFDVESFPGEFPWFLHSVKCTALHLKP